MGLRWAVSLSSVEKAVNFEYLFRRCLYCLPLEDVERQNMFHFREDGLACVIARILIRSSVTSSLNLPWSEIDITKGMRGKPLVKGKQYFFNVSHQGDLVVLATSDDKEIGVDVMEINESRDRTSLEHIERMQKLFTDEEQSMMKAKDSERLRWTAFYRVWCLKEAVLKATGEGLVNNLRRFAFHVDESVPHSPGAMILNTTWSLDGTLQKNWLFEESFVNAEHCIAVASICTDEVEVEQLGKQLDLKPSNFEMVSLEKLLEKSSPLNTLNDDEVIEHYERYSRKPSKLH